MQTPTATTTTTTIMSYACPKCVRIEKSGKMSCCSRGGSWFGTCGSGVNSNLEHTWYEGVRVCKPREQSKTIIGHQLNGAQQSSMGSSNGTDMSNSKVVTTVAKTLTSPSANTLLYIPSNTSVAGQASTGLLNAVVHIGVLFIF